jgi:class 3 adenylate cyclase
MKVTPKAILLFGTVALVTAIAPLPLVLPSYANAILVSAQTGQLHVAKDIQSQVDAHVSRRIDDGRELAALLGRTAALAPDEGARAAALAFETQSSFDVGRLVVERDGVILHDTVFSKSGADPTLAPRAELDLLREARAGFAQVRLDDRRILLAFALEPPPGAGRPAVARGFLLLPLYTQPLDLALEGAWERRARGDRDMTVFVLDADRRVLAARGVDAANKGSPAPELCTLDLLAGVPSGPPVGISGVCARGAGEVGSVQTTASLGWTVVVVEPEAVVLAEYHATRRTLLFGAGFALVVASMLAAWLGRSVASPVLRLVDQARRIGARRWTELLPAERRADELGVLDAALLGAGQELARQEEQLAKEAKVRADLARFLSPELVERALSGELDLSLGGRRQSISVLFADVVAFTPLAEQRPAEETVAILNELFGLLTEIVFRHGGFVDKFIGDAVMAVFGAPDPAPDHADRALRCAEDIMRLVDTIGATFEREHNVTIRLSVGINSGEAVMGNVGSERRMDYTAIGDVVNVASRLEGVAAPNQVLVGEGTRALASDAFELRRLGTRQLLGRSHETTVFELVV